MTKIKDQAFDAPVLLWSLVTGPCGPVSEKNYWKAYKVRRVQSLTASHVELRLMAINLLFGFPKKKFEKVIWTDENMFVLDPDPTGRKIVIGHPCLQTNYLNVGRQQVPNAWTGLD